MKGLLQRVTEASVTVGGDVVGAIGRGLLLFLAVEPEDSERTADRLLEKVLAYRVFPDDDDRMNLSLSDISGDLLVVSQFTLAADTSRGLRPSFSSAADPEKGKALYDYFVARAREQVINLATGRYGADMKVRLVNDGPVTFLLEVKSNG